MPTRAGVCESKLEGASEAAAMPVATRAALRRLATAGRVRAEEVAEPRALPPFYTGPPPPPQVRLAPMAGAAIDASITSAIEIPFPLCVCGVMGADVG